MQDKSVEVVDCQAGLPVLLPVPNKIVVVVFAYLVKLLLTRLKPSKTF